MLKKQIQTKLSHAEAIQDLAKQEKRRSVKKMFKWTLIGAGVLVALAVVVGVCNALFADGKWTFGWKNYTYDESGYELGSGTVSADGVQNIDLRWVDGIVQILPCDDRYISVTESASKTLTDAETLRWKVLEDGKTLSVQYRKSSWFLGSGSDKNVTLRIPRTMLDGLVSVTVTADSTDILIKEIKCGTLSVTTQSGDLRAIDCVCDSLFVISKTGEMRFDGTACPNQAQFDVDRGNVTLAFPTDADFRLYWQGELASDLPIVKEAEQYVSGEGKAQIYVNSKHGAKLRILEYAPKE